MSDDFYDRDITVEVNKQELALLRGMERISSHPKIQKLLDMDDTIIVPIVGHSQKGEIGRDTYDQALCLIELGRMSEEEIEDLVDVRGWPSG